MKQYRVRQTIDLHGGLIRLSEDQAEGRAHRLKRLDEDLYEITSPIQFKVGEVFHIEVPPKVVLLKLIDVAAESKASKAVSAAKEVAEKVVEKVAPRRGRRTAKKTALKRKK